jgi:CRP/FNR family cyclic AMP-dependent transcriptional regulator
MAEPRAHRRSESRSWDGWRWPSQSFLGSLSSTSRAQFLELGATRQYLSGDVLIREGDASRHLIVLLDGVVKATGLTPDGKETLLAIRIGGDIVGEMAALDERPRNSGITACGVVVGRVIKQADFLDAIRRDPALSYALTRAVAAKLRQADARRVEFAGYDAPTRLARVLRELATRYGENGGNRIVLSWPLTQTELASLREDGIISTGYRTLAIEDLLALDRICGA